MTHTAKDSIPAGHTLADLFQALGRGAEIAETKRRQTRSAVLRVAKLFGDAPERIPLDIAHIRARFEEVSPAAKRISPKTLANVRTEFMAAVRASGLLPALADRPGTVPLRPRWIAFFAHADERTRRGLSRLSKYACARGLDPRDVDDALLEALLTNVSATSLMRRQRAFHRNTVILWNRMVARNDNRSLQELTLPPVAWRLTRVPICEFPATFAQDIDAWAEWVSGSDPFAADAPERPLAASTIRTRRDYISAAATALVETGVSPSDVEKLADLVKPEALKAILRRRYGAVGRRPTVYNSGLATTMVQIGRDWVGVGAGTLEELRRLSSKLPYPELRMTEKNKATLRQFTDPEIVQRFLHFPDRVWKEVRRNQRPSLRLLAQAQAALACDMLINMPIRLENLAQLTFDKHIHLRTNGPSTLELAAHEVKNDQEMQFEIPPHVADKLVEYRDDLAPRVLGQRPVGIFVNPDGTIKSKLTITPLLKRHLKRWEGVTMNTHAFRHLAGKFILDKEPGAHELVKQLLGHKKIETTVAFYTGVDTLRAGRHHFQLLQERAEQNSRTSAPGRVRAGKSTRRV